MESGVRSQEPAGSGDYTRDRHRWLDGATVQEIMAEIGRRPPSV